MTKLLKCSRGAYGLMLLTRPALIARLAGGSDRPRKLVAVIRILGVRHLIQAALQAMLDGPRSLAVGAAVDAIHGASSIWLAVASSRWRRVGVLDGALAAGWSASGVAAARRARNHGTPRAAR